MIDIDRQATIDECMNLPDDISGLEIIIRNLAKFAYKNEPINHDDLDVMFFLIGIAAAKVWNIRDKEKINDREEK